MPRWYHCTLCSACLPRARAAEHLEKQHSLGDAQVEAWLEVHDVLADGVSARSRTDQQGDKPR